MEKITKKDVFLYYAKKLSRKRRCEIEEASKSDKNVCRWLSELSSTKEEREKAIKEIKIDWNSSEQRELAAYILWRMLQEEDEK